MANAHNTNSVCASHARDTVYITQGLSSYLHHLQQFWVREKLVHSRCREAIASVRGSARHTIGGYLALLHPGASLLACLLLPSQPLLSSSSDALPLPSLFELLDCTHNVPHDTRGTRAHNIHTQPTVCAIYHEPLYLSVSSPSSTCAHEFFPPNITVM